MTSSIWAGSRPSFAALTTWSARLNAVVSRSVPRPAVPIGVRSADTSTASGMVASHSAFSLRMIFSLTRTILARLGDPACRSVGARQSSLAEPAGWARPPCGACTRRVPGSSSLMLRTRRARRWSRNSVAAGGRLLGKDGSPVGLDGFRTTIESYLVSFFNVMRLAAAAIARSEPAEDGGRGVIINTASIAAYEGQIGQLPYAAAKGGIVSMTLVAARDLSPTGIRVVTIAPGTILTPAYGKAGDQLEAYWGPQVPHPKRMGRPGEYAALVQAIAENDYLNGEVIRLDGALRFPPK